MADTLETAETVKRSTPVALWRTVILVAGDVASFLVFAGVGRRQHGETSGLSALLTIAETAAPFALGWFLVSPWVGAYRARLTDTVRRMLSRTELSWIAAFPAAYLLRFLFGGVGSTVTDAITFGLVILISNAIFLGLWRSVFAAIEGWLKRRL